MNKKSCCTTVRVQNLFGATLRSVTVKHRFRMDGKDEEFTWYNIKNGQCTSSNLPVHYQVGLGALTDHDWWRVIFTDEHGMEHFIDPYYCSEGYKRCYLREADVSGPVTIKIQANASNGIEIVPWVSSSSSTNWSTSPGGGLRDLTAAATDLGRAAIAAASGENIKKEEEKINYYCPACGEDTWSYSGFEGNTCRSCKLSPKGGAWGNLLEKHAKKLPNLGYNADGKTVKFFKCQFENVIPSSKWKGLERYQKIDGDHMSGLNAINMALLMWEYDKQMKKDEYSHMQLPLTNLNWEMSGEDFYNHNIKGLFDTHSFKSRHAIAGLNYTFQWDYIDDNDYTKYTIIAMGGYNLKVHYFLIIGVSTKKTHYLILDTSQCIWLVEKKLMQTLCVYTSNGYLQHSLYKIGHKNLKQSSS